MFICVLVGENRESTLAMISPAVEKQKSIQSTNNVVQPASMTVTNRRGQLESVVFQERNVFNKKKKLTSLISNLGMHICVELYPSQKNQRSDVERLKSQRVHTEKQGAAT